MLRRVGAIGDVHAEDDALHTALCFLQKRDVDAIVCLGDIVDGMGDSDRTCALLRDAGVVCVRGF